MSSAAGCDGKKGLASRALADSILSARGGSRTAYRCSSCALWHLGHSTARRAVHQSRNQRIASIRQAEASEGLV